MEHKHGPNCKHGHQGQGGHGHGGHGHGGHGHGGHGNNQPSINPT